MILLIFYLLFIFTIYHFILNVINYVKFVKKDKIIKWIHFTFYLVTEFLVIMIFFSFVTRLIFLINFFLLIFGSFETREPSNSQFQ